MCADVALSLPLPLFIPGNLRFVAVTVLATAKDFFSNLMIVIGMVDEEQPSHLGLLWGGTPGATYESLLGHLHSFCVSV